MIQEKSQSFSQLHKQYTQPKQITVLSILDPQAYKAKNNSVFNELKILAENMFYKAKQIIAPLVTNSNSIQMKIKTQIQEEKQLKKETIQQISVQNKNQNKTKKIQKSVKRYKGCSYQEWSKRQDQKINQSFIRKRICQKRNNRSQNSLLNLSRNQQGLRNNKQKINKTILNLSDINSQFSDYLQNNNRINLDKSFISLQDQTNNGPQLLNYPDFSKQTILQVSDNFQTIIQKFDKYKRDHFQMSNDKSNLNEIIRKKPKLQSQLNKNSVKIYQKLIAQMQPVTQNKTQSLTQSYLHFKNNDKKYTESIKKSQKLQNNQDLPIIQRVDENPLILRRKLYNFKINEQNKFDLFKSFKNISNLHKEQLERQKLRKETERVEQQLRIAKQKQQEQLNRKKQEELKKRLQEEILAKNQAQLQQSINKPTDQEKQILQKSAQGSHQLLQNTFTLKQQKNPQNNQENKPSSFGQALIQKEKSEEINENKQNEKTQIKQISKLEYKVSVNESNFPNIVPTAQIAAPQSPKVTTDSQLKVNNPFLNPPSNKKIMLMDELMKKNPQVVQKIQGFNFSSPTKTPNIINNSLFQSPQKKSSLFDLGKNPSQLSTPIFNKNVSNQFQNQLDSSMCDQVSQSNVPAIDNSFVQNSFSNSFSGGHIVPTSNILSNSGSNLFSNVSNSFSKVIPPAYQNSSFQDNLNMFGGTQFNPPITNTINKSQALNLFMPRPPSNDSFSLFGNPPNNMQFKKSDRQRKKKGKQERIS